MEPAIRAEGIAKKFCRTISHTMLYGATDLYRSFFGLDQRTETLRKGEFWALDGVSFEIKRGEVFGIIGPNGSGKSTILKILNGIYMPDKGKVEIRGRVGALIEVGAGFHPMLTGRENVYVNGAILGMSKREIDAKFDEIVDFADIGDFIDSPVKHYSSGMFVRLGFAVAVHCEPEILLIDEILSVGDAAFRIKSMNRMMEIVESGATVCFVSHDLMGVENICNRVLWLDRGVIEEAGDKAEVLSKYVMNQRTKAVDDAARLSDRKKGALNETDLIWVTDCKIVGEGGEPVDSLGYRDNLTIRIHYKTREPVEKPYFMVYVLDFSSQTIFHANMLADGREPEVLSGEGWLDVDFGNPPLCPGAYMVRVQIRRDSTSEHFYIKTVARFTVEASPEEYGFTGDFKSVYTYGSGIALPYEYRWGEEETVKVEKAADAGSSPSTTNQEAV